MAAFLSLTNRREERRSLFLDYSFVLRIQDQRNLTALSLLLNGEKPPVRIPCEELFAIEHVDCCSDLIEVRERYFTAPTLRVLFKGVPLDCV